MIIFVCINWLICLISSSYCIDIYLLKINRRVITKITITNPSHRRSIFTHCGSFMLWDWPCPFWLSHHYTLVRSRYSRCYLILRGTANWFWGIMPNFPWLCFFQRLIGLISTFHTRKWTMIWAPVWTKLPRPTSLSSLVFFVTGPYTAPLNAPESPQSDSYKTPNPHFTSILPFTQFSRFPLVPLSYHLNLLPPVLCPCSKCNTCKQYCPK
jgi:hypothetical protein